MEFTDKETELFDFLLLVAKNKSPETTLRVAGGWVRDKLLGTQSHDIDIAVDNMSGLAFVKLICEFMEENSIKHGKPSVIEARPEQSKHLETAMFTVMGFT